jgi:hypothetical protein
MQCSFGDLMRRLGRVFLIPVEHFDGCHGLILRLGRAVLGDLPGFLLQILVRLTPVDHTDVV